MVKSTIDTNWDWYDRESIDQLVNQSNDINRLTKKADRDFKRLDMIYEIESKYNNTLGHELELEHEPVLDNATIIGFDIGDNDHYMVNIRVWIPKYKTIEKIVIKSKLTMLHIESNDTSISIYNNDSGQGMLLSMYQDVMINIVPYSKEIIFSKKLITSMIEPALNELINFV